MKFSIGDRILTKKPHACGKNEWVIVRTGADIKLKCCNCDHTVFVSIDQLKKMIKSYYPADSSNE